MASTCRSAWVTYTQGHMPILLLVGFMIPMSFVTFGLGILFSVLGLPDGFDYGSCVISRLSSSYHNPRGHVFLTLGLIGVATFLAPAPAWYARSFGGCARLGECGRKVMWAGLIASAWVGIERAWCPTHWSKFEVFHLTQATIAFLGLWLGMAMLAGTDLPPGQSRVRWRWLLRPPWYLALCVLPILVLGGMYLPFALMPAARKVVIESWPRPLVFLRTATFWQWYLVGGLALSVASITRQAYIRHHQRLLAAGPWRLDPPHALAYEPHLQLGTVEVSR
jgi:hypothetical protein